MCSCKYNFLGGTLDKTKLLNLLSNYNILIMNQQEIEIVSTPFFLTINQVIVKNYFLSDHTYQLDSVILDSVIMYSF